MRAFKKWGPRILRSIPDPKERSYYNPVLYVSSLVLPCHKKMVEKIAGGRRGKHIPRQHPPETSDRVLSFRYPTRQNELILTYSVQKSSKAWDLLRC